MAEISINWPYLKLSKDLIPFKPVNLSLVFEGKGATSFSEMAICTFLFNQGMKYVRD
jgi:hypothetical protein